MILGASTPAASPLIGRCECFTMVDVVDGQIGEVEILHNAPHAEGGCLPPALVLAEHSVEPPSSSRHRRPTAAGLQPGGHCRARRAAGADVQTAVRAYIRGDLPAVGIDGTCRH